MAHLPTAIAALAKLETAACDVTLGSRENRSVPEHTHDTTNYGVITEGTLYLTLHGEEKSYNKGDWFCVPAKTPHAERFEAKTSVVVFWVK